MHRRSATRTIDHALKYLPSYTLPVLLVLAMSLWGAVAVLQSNPPPLPELSASAPASMPETEDSVPPPDPKLYEYVEVVESCGVNYEGTCINLRTGPGVDYPAALKLRTGVVLKTSGIVEVNGEQWYKIAFDEWLRYPERLDGERYIAASLVRPFKDAGALDMPEGGVESTKRIIVDRSEQKLYAYDGDALFMEESISTGLELTPTPRGQFKVYRKTPSRYMQGPIPGISEKVFDLPGVPWNLYFTYEGAVIHGAYWHNHFGEPWSNGCVNLPPEKARELYEWADLGTSVIVRD